MNNKYKIFARPYLIWLIIFALIPMVIMFFLVPVQSEGISLEDMAVSGDAFLLFIDSSTLVAIFNSLLYAIITTVLCIFLGYLVSWTIYKSKIKNKFFVLVIFILPMWSNLLLRVQAIGSLMDENNILTDIMSNIGFHFSLNLNGSPFAIIVGMVVTYLPFMILPIYNALEKIDISLHEASLDLGVPELKTFLKVYLPLSLKGIVSGSIMVFLPAVSGFAIPQILGKGNILLIGNIIEQSFKNMNYNFGSLLAIFLLLIILGALTIINKTDKEGETLL